MNDHNRNAPSVSEGYKNSELGIIPENWDTPSLGAIFSFKNGLNKAKEYFGYGTPIVNYMDVYKRSSIRSSDIKGRVSVSREELKSYEVRKSDVLFTRTSETVDEVGIAAVILDDLKSTVFSGFVLRARPQDDSLDDEFKRFCFSSKCVRRQIISKSTYTTRALTNGRVLSSVLLPRPPKHEQQSIAAALSDVESLIEKLQKLIAKKCAIKRGAMQELLTGKRRLPGFTGEWNSAPLKEATDCLDNLRVPLNDSQRSTMRGDIPYCGANGVMDFVNDYVIDDDVILIAEDGGYFDEYEYRPIAYRMIGKCWVNNHVHILKAKPGFDQGFVFYSLQHKNILRFLASGTRAKLNKSEMYKIEIDVPPDKSEQEAIAQVLDDLGAEISVLEKALYKNRLLKMGMMQALLTGEIRLPIE